MATFGLTTAGFIPKDLLSIQADLQAAFQSKFGQSIDLSPSGPFGQLIGILSERIAELWNLGQTMDTALNPDAATGPDLDKVCAITGTIRLPATRSAVTLTLTGTPGSTVSAFVGSVVATKARFDTLTNGTLVAATAWAGSTVTAVGARVTNASNIYLCTTAGTTAASGGPTGTSSTITDGTAVWRYLGAGTAFVDIAASAELTGPVVALSGTLTTIETPTAGVSNVINILDAVPGTNLETDAAVRLRRESELRGSGKAALEAIRSAVLLTSGIISAKVFENTTDVVDSNGNAPHSVEVLVQGATDLVAATAIFQSVAAGINTVGNTSAVVTDSQGFTHTVGFSRPVIKPIYVILNVTVDPLVFAATGPTLIKAAVAAFGNLSVPGKDAVSSSIGAQAFTIPGVLDVTSTLIGLINPPTTSATVSVALRELATYDTSRIVVNVVNGIP